MIKLYIYQGCPYCKKVLKYFDEINLKENEDYKIIDAMEHMQELKEISGKTQCPYLVDGNTKMPESDDIIAYVKERFSK